MTTFGPVGVIIVVGTPAVTEHVSVRCGSNARLGTGAVTSFTVTVKLVLVPSGLLVQVTTVSPAGKKEPDVWSHVTGPQSVATTAKGTLAPHVLAALSTTIGAGGVKTQEPPRAHCIDYHVKGTRCAGIGSVASGACHQRSTNRKLEPDW